MRHRPATSQADGLLAIAQQIALAAALQLRAGARREEGQGLVEYALILAVIAILTIAALAFLRQEIESVFTSIGNAI